MNIFGAVLRPRLSEVCSAKAEFIIFDCYKSVVNRAIQTALIRLVLPVGL